MRAVQLLLALLARDVDMCAVCSDDVVAAVGGRVEDGLVLAHQGECYAGGEAAEGAFVASDIDMVPCAGVGKACLCSLSVYSNTLATAAHPSRVYP